MSARELGGLKMDAAGDPQGLALVTGAPGDRRCAALAPAEAGYDVAITARTVREGEGRADPVSVSHAGAAGCPGGLERTASEIAALGRRAISIQMDLLDRESVVRASEEVGARWRRRPCQRCGLRGPRPARPVPRPHS